MTDELKSCANCGNAEIKPMHVCNSNKPLYRVKCYKCGMQTHLDDIDKVIAAWNSRHESDELIKMVQTRIDELEEQIEENCTYRSKDLVNHEIVTLKWVLTLRKTEDKE